MPGTSRAPGATRRISSTETWAVSSFLALSTLAIYAQVRSHNFITYDDPLYVTQNPQVMRGLALDGVRWALMSGHAGNWHPLTWVSHMLDIQLWGVDAGAHLLVNVCMHVVSTILLYGLLRRTTGMLWPSVFVASIFALHPLRVESVAWVAERKDVLSTMLWMLTMWAYLLYVERRDWRRYALLLVSFALGLMAKPMLVTLPFVLLLFDLWPLGRWGLDRGRQSPLPSLVVEKLPLMALAVASSLVTLIVQGQAGAVSSMEALSLGQRFANATVAYVSYLGKLFWPAHLAVLYPYRIPLPAWEVAGALVILIGASVFALRMRHRHPYLLVGWLWYLGTLVPVIGFVQVGEQSMADRYTYIPMIGILIAIAWGVPGMLTRWRRRNVGLSFAAGAAVAACALVSWAHLHHWKDSETLYRHALAVTTDNVPMHNNLGLVLMERGQLQEAANHFRAALQTRPTHAKAHVNLALTLFRQGDLTGAALENRQALQLAPHLPEAHSNLAQVLQAQGDLAAAEAEYREAQRLSPGNGELQYNLGIVLLLQRRPDEAIGAFEQAIRLAPNLIEARNNLAAALSQAGRLQEARDQFEELLRLRPGYADAHYNLAILLIRLGEVASAIPHLETAVRLRPDLTQARAKLTELVGQQGTATP